MLWQICSGLAMRPRFQPNFGPDRYGDINLHPTNSRATRDFLIDILNFRVSDAIGSEAFFLRCNSDQHGVALIQGRSSLHHHAWQVQSIADLSRLADRLDEANHRLLWGPVRHGLAATLLFISRIRPDASSRCIPTSNKSTTMNAHQLSSRPKTHAGSIDGPITAPPTFGDLALRLENERSDLRQR